ncbi:hypothetical protein [Spirochaeta dissipatitropha]
MIKYLYRIFYLILTAACIFAGTALLYHTVPGADDLFSKLSPIHRERRGASSPQLVEDNPIGMLVTGQLNLKTVFPHDYIPPGYSLDHIRMRAEEAVRPLREELTARELSFYRLSRLCEDIGWAADPTSPDFIVLNISINVGYDLIRMDSVDPGSEILDIQIVDFSSQNYPYPPPRLGPEEIRRISSFIQQEIPQHQFIQVLLQRASDNAARFLIAGGGQYD